MIDALLIIGIVAAYLVAMAIMSKLSKNVSRVKFRATGPVESGAYDPSEDPEKIMKGEIESYFD